MNLSTNLLMKLLLNPPMNITMNLLVKITDNKNYYCFYYKSNSKKI